MFNWATALEKVSTRWWKIPTTLTGAMWCRTSQLCAYLDELDVTDWNLGWTTDINWLFASFYGAEIKW
jgi:hypothetical protein